MWFYVTIGILLGYTIALAAFFMGWCTLVPIRCHPRKEIPFSLVKSPRRNTMYFEIDSTTSSISTDTLKQVTQKSAAVNKYFDNKKHSLSLPAVPHKCIDHLYPQLSLPPVAVNIDAQYEFEQLLKTPGRAWREHSSFSGTV
ncbi:unnamed protein product [Cylicocyclus nassatus]|uniref:Uncharacterized protein n=1 Tax=Cylicocyclus nassatus TaxID=53992 RepID=A0AA36DSQ9_CYLNA|nr:unnamed protein product [Cylicocyclus nassatus]